MISLISATTTIPVSSAPTDMPVKSEPSHAVSGKWKSEACSVSPVLLISAYSMPRSSAMHRPTPRIVSST